MTYNVFGGTLNLTQSKSERLLRLYKGITSRLYCSVTTPHVCEQLVVK